MSDVTVEVHVGEGLSLPLDSATVAAAVRTVLVRERAARAEVSIAFVDDAEISRLNQDYLSHEGPTDVISFPLSMPGDPVVGDVYVGAEQAMRQADELGVPLAEELIRLAIHGTLHVLGYDHPEGSDRADSEMYRLQEELVAEILGGPGGGSA